METIGQFASSGVAYLILLFIRTSGMIISSPIFGRQNIPSIVKISFSLALAYFFYKAVPQIQPVECDTVIMFIAYIAKELLLGLIMGYLLTMFFNITFTAGQLIDMQIGLGMASVYDPQSNASVPLMGNMLNVVMMLLFFAGEGHKRLIGIMYVALWRIPIGTVTPVGTMALSLLEAFCTSFLLAVRLAMPVIAGGLLCEAILGLVIRTVPQMNVFAVGLPLKIILGFLIMLGAVPLMSELMNGIFEQMFVAIEGVFADVMNAGAA